MNEHIVHLVFHGNLNSVKRYTVQQYMLGERNSIKKMVEGSTYLQEECLPCLESEGFRTYRLRQIIKIEFI